MKKHKTTTTKFNAKELMTRINSLRTGDLTASEIVNKLNSAGYATKTGKDWTVSNYNQFLTTYGTGAVANMNDRIPNSKVMVGVVSVKTIQAILGDDYLSKDTKLDAFSALGFNDK